ncbi:MAG TPA: transglycosylase domain-containing protein [Herpetosiphonaceae bacterium]|nr:transglycosylase domain-containing protein [Herpetosiphonaceae bacterium]
MAIYDGGNRGHHAAPGIRRTNKTKTRVPPQILRELGATRPKPYRGPLLAILLALSAVMLFVPAVALAAGVAYYNSTAAALRPRIDQLATYHERAFQTSRVFDRNGQLLYEFVNAGRRDPVKLNQIADVLKQATIAVENKNFYEDAGVDYLGIAKALYRNFTSGAEVSGASTITQQLVKLVLLTPQETSYENRYKRKLTEVVLAREVNSRFTKDQILELYLNEINYGNLSYGIQAAAKGYFGINASELNLNQASLLAGLPQSPTYYNPIQFLQDGRILKGVILKPNWLNPAAPLPYGITPPRARQVAVLRQMVLNGKVSEPVARETITQDLQFVEQVVPLRAPHFVFYLKQVLEKDPTIGPLLVNEGGLNITTTLDLRIQALAQQEAARRIDELEKENRNIHNAAVVVEQPHTGQILAMVGSIDYNRSKATTTPGMQGNVMDGNVNVATRDRQPGSALKPFTYLSSLAQGKLDAGSVLWDVETKFPIVRGQSNKRNLKDPNFWYGPKNFDQKWHGPMRIREALAGSLNMPAVEALKIGGVPQTIDLLHRAGVTGLNQPSSYYGLSLTLGGGAVTPLDLTTAYNTLANDGEFVPATPILRITDRSGKELKYNAGQPQQAADKKYVAIVRDFMGDNEARIPIFGKNNPLKLSRPAHVKTGTSEDFRDAWAIGYTPYVTVGVWTGNNNNEKTARVESTVGGGVIWNRIMEDLFKNPDFDRLLRGPNLSAPLDFPDLSTYGLEQRNVCAIGGPFGKRTTEWFVKGQKTAQDNCDLYKTITVANEPRSGTCLVPQDSTYKGRVQTLKVWSLPTSTDEQMVINPTWNGGSLKNGGTLPGAPLPLAPDHACSGAKPKGSP